MRCSTEIDEVVDDALGHSFAFRVLAGPDGEERLAFNTGLCLQAHRAELGQAVSWADRIVQQAILIMWEEPWMQEFAETQDRMRRDFVAALIRHPGFQRDYPRCIELAAIELDQAIAWSD